MPKMGTPPAKKKKFLITIPGFICPQEKKGEKKKKNFLFRPGGGLFFF